MSKLLKSICVVVLFSCQSLYGQDFDSWFTGDTADVSTSVIPGTVLMGGSAENDSAMVWWLSRSGGGDVLVIRASGSNGYNDYLYQELGQQVNSVETIRFNNRQASYNPYVIKRLMQAEALWIAGGDQWNYTRFWKETPVDSLINWLATVKKIPVGGTSAGMAILGDAYFNAMNGSVTSAEALANPYSSLVSIGRGDFIHIPILKKTITDTHFDNPDRRGRTVAFLGRLYQDSGFSYRAICSEEKTAVCIDSAGIGRIYGNSPATEFAYFIQTNCAADSLPEVCQPGQPLTWSHGNKALKVYKVPGTPNGAYTFDLNDWQTGSGGVWQDWRSNTGSFGGNASGAPDCFTNVLPENSIGDLRVFPNPSSGVFSIDWVYPVEQIEVTDATGRCTILPFKMDKDNLWVDGNRLNAGIYWLSIKGQDRVWKGRKIRLVRY